MKRVLHLSDLHLGTEEPGQDRLFDALIQALRGLEADLLVFTGDVFDSSILHPKDTVRRFIELLDRIEPVVGKGTPTLILPGNHDRRELGILYPFNSSLFAELKTALAHRPQIRVLGTRTPFLAEYIELEGFPAHIVAYDSTYLPRGWISAGGVLRQEDLLQVAEHMLDVEDTRPVLFFVHHHMVPTPVTDVGDIDTSGKGAIVSLVVRHLLPALVSNADREELTMTALGAGTALSTLHGLGRAVMVMHGHKHYPTARLLKALQHGEGDLLLLAAGSCGTSESWHSAPKADAPKLWPSFNVIELDGDRVRAESVAFPPEVGPEVWKGRPRVNRRPLVEAVRHGKHFEPDPDGAVKREFVSSLELNEAEIAVEESKDFFDRYDLQVKRRLKSVKDGDLETYREIIEGPSGARLVEARAEGIPVDAGRVPIEVQVPLDGTLEYRLLGGACATMMEASKEYGEGTAFESVGLFNRYRAKVARLSVKLKAAQPDERRPFASVTDLTTGRERAVKLERDETAHVYSVSVTDCPARALLRIWWPLG